MNICQNIQNTTTWICHIFTNELGLADLLGIYGHNMNLRYNSNFIQNSALVTCCCLLNDNETKKNYPYLLNFMLFISPDSACFMYWMTLPEKLTVEMQNQYSTPSFYCISMQIAAYVCFYQVCLAVFLHTNSIWNPSSWSFVLTCMQRRAWETCFFILYTAATRTYSWIGSDNWFMKPRLRNGKCSNAVFITYIA